MQEHFNAGNINLEYLVDLFKTDKIARVLATIDWPKGPKIIMLIVCGIHVTKRNNTNLTGSPEDDR